jgi:hypothetical protein
MHHPRMAGDRDHPGVGGVGGVGGSQPAVELVREHQVRQLGLRVRALPVVVPLGLQIGEVNDALQVPDAAHGHDPGTRRQPVEQQSGQRERAKVVGGQGQLEAVRGPLVGHLHHARVVDDQVQTRKLVPDPRRGGAYRRLRCQVQRDDGHVGPDRLGGAVGLVGVPAGEDDMRAAGGEDTGGLQAQSGICPGHDGHTS